MAAPPATTHMVPHPPRSLPRRWLWPALVAAAAAALWGLAPTLVRWQVQRQAAALWPGEITIEHVELHGLASIELRGVRVRDSAGEGIAAFGLVTVDVQRFAWNGPVAARMVIRGVTLPAAAGRTATLPVTMVGAVTTPHRGALHLNGWRVDYRDVPVVQEVAADLASGDSGLSVDGLAGRLLGAPLAVEMDASHGATGTGFAGATVSARAIPLAALARLLPADERLTHGSAAVELTLHRNAETGWAVDGRLHVVDADLRGFSLARKLCHFLAIQDLAPLATVEAEIAFELSGTVATITGGRVASGLPEMAIEPDSRIDLSTGEIDASVVLAAGAKLGELPLLHPVGTLVKHLTRIRTHGHWRDPEEELFSRD